MKYGTIYNIPNELLTKCFSDRKISELYTGFTDKQSINTLYSRSLNYNC